jgi:AcrR family transcriptional regulator
MPRPPSSASREEVLAAAIAILRDAGPAALTVRAVAQAAGCSTMAVYTHFDGKAGLVDAILAAGYEGVNAALDDSARDDAYDDVLVSEAVEYRRWALAHPIEYQAMYSSLVPYFQLSEATRELAEEGFARHRERVAQALAIDDATAERVARHLWASVHGHVIFEIRDGVTGDDDERAEAFLEAARWMRKGVAR